METPDTSVKIKFLIEMALQGEISWLALDPVINRLTPTLEKSRQIIKIILIEFESHQMICTKKISKEDDDFPEDIADMNKDQSSVNEMKIIQRSNSEEDEIEIIDKKQLPEEIMKIQDEEISTVEDFTNVNNEHDETDPEFSEADSEVFDENDVSKSIQLVEAFKGQLYTFVGDDSGEKAMRAMINH